MSVGEVKSSADTMLSICVIDTENSPEWSSLTILNHDNREFNTYTVSNSVVACAKYSLEKVAVNWPNVKLPSDHVMEPDYAFSASTNTPHESLENIPHILHPCF